MENSGLLIAHGIGQLLCVFAAKSSASLKETQLQHSDWETQFQASLSNRNHELGSLMPFVFDFPL